MRLSVIIVSWNTRALLLACLESLVASLRAIRPEEIEVLVVDNASHDGTVPAVRARFPGVRLIANRENVGFARANNQALHLATGEFLLLLNPDTEVQPGALEALVDFIAPRPEVGGVGARLLNADGSLQHSCAPEPTLRREAWRLFHLDRLRPVARYPMQRWDPGTPREVEVVQGAALLLRREVLATVGLLDEAYFIYSEEVDLCTRVRRAGWALFWVPQAIVVHHGGQSTRQVATEMFLRLYAGKLLYFRKHGGTLAPPLYKLLLLFAALARVALAPLSVFEPPGRRHYHRRLAADYMRLIRTLPAL